MTCAHFEGEFLVYPSGCAIAYEGDRMFRMYDATGDKVGECFEDYDLYNRFKEQGLIE
tara:strand:+ start:1243 stop:1416 length:174 start_codon:yes stop_codon:yes gene_type:complete